MLGGAAGYGLSGLNPMEMFSAIRHPLKFIGKGILSGMTPEAEATAATEPTAPPPFRPNPAIARRIKFGGPPPPSYNPPGTIIPRGRFVPPIEPEPVLETPQAPTPFRPNPAIARRIKFGGSTSEAGMPKSTGGRVRPVTPAPIKEGFPTPKAAGVVPPVGTPTPTNATVPPVTNLPDGLDPSYLEGYDTQAVKNAVARQAKAQKIMQTIKADPKGISPDSITDPAERSAWAKKAGFNRPFSDKTGDLTWRKVVMEYDKTLK